MTLLPIMLSFNALFSVAPVNDMASVYQYKANISFEADVQGCSGECSSGNTTQYFDSYARLTFSGSLYYNIDQQPYGHYITMDSIEVSWFVYDSNQNRIGFESTTVGLDDILPNDVDGNRYELYFYTSQSDDELLLDCYNYYQGETTNYITMDSSSMDEPQDIVVSLFDSNIFVNFDSFQSQVSQYLGAQNSDSFSAGYSQGYSEGQSQGFDDGSASGYTKGYSDGYKNASDQGSATTAIFTGIINVALLPINFFLAIFNFEVFGINIGAFVASLMTIAVVVILFRTIFSGGNKSND